MNNLKDYVNWKLTHADKTAEAEGYPLIMENCKANKQMKQLEIYGNSFQDGTPTPDNPIEVQSVGEMSVNLFDISSYPLVNNRVIYGHSGEYGTVSGYAATHVYIPCTELQGKTITINHTAGANVGIAFYDESKVYISGEKYSNATSKTVTIPNDAIYYRFSVDANYIDEIQIQEGSVATEYEPYGKYKIPIVQRGTNLINVNDFKNGNFKVSADGSCTLSWTLSNRFGAYNTKLSHIPAGSKLVFKTSILEATTNYKYVLIQLTYSNGTTKYLTCLDSTRITLEDTIKQVGLYIHNSEEKGSYITFNDFGLYYENEYTGYESYVEPTTTNVFLNEPLRKIGGYADYIDSAKSKVVRAIKQQIINGTESFKRFNGAYPYSLIEIGEPGYVVDDVCLCNNLTHQPNFSISREGINTFRIFNSYSNYSARIAFRIYVDGEPLRENDTVKFMQDKYASGTPVIFYYVLSEPYEESIDCDLPKLNAKTSIIEVDTSITPSDAYGKYIKR